MAGGKGIKGGDITVVGIPSDKNSSYLRGPALAPRRIREALFCESSNMWTEDLIDLGEFSGWEVLDDMRLSSQENVSELIENEIRQLLKRRLRVISLGGDHSITRPIIRAYGKGYQNLNILHLDAHPDLYDEFDGNQYSHACPFARILEENMAIRLVQVGIRTMDGHQYEQAKRFGVEVIEMKDIGKIEQIKFDGPVYLSLDLDCLDPAYAPGVSHHEPGGMSTREVLGIIRNFKGRLVGADIVEYNPERDLHGMTGMVAGKILKEIIGRMLGEASC
ncbi:MAG: agmatinase [Desulfobacterales bacterium]|nr:agmatinase [Desulfobacterales bacterium]